MKRPLLLILSVVAVAAVAGWWLLASSRTGWTTSSEEAALELDRGVEAVAKFYHAEARGHFERALQLDPAFVVAKVFLLDSQDKSDSDTPKRLREELVKADLGRLSPRERFLVRYRVARMEKRPDDARRLLQEHLAEFPDDPYALDIQGRIAVSEQDWDTAQRVYERLIQAAPNRVESYNQLGYLAMAQGRFNDAENMFRTYRYLAPDQANPRDSLGELLTLVGRYEEAEAEFEGALQQRPDFCPSVGHLVTLSTFDRNFGRARRVLDRAAANRTCEASELKSLECHLRLVQARLANDWEAAWQAGGGPCATTAVVFNPLRHEAAVMTGRADEVAAISRGLAEHAAKYGSGASGRYVRSQQAHFEAVRQLAAGQGAAALASFEAADRELQYWGLDEGELKLTNRLAWLAALRAAGLQPEAERLAAQVSRVNPRLLQTMADVDPPGLHVPSGERASASP